MLSVGELVEGHMTIMTRHLRKRIARLPMRRTARKTVTVHAGDGV